MGTRFRIMLAVLVCLTVFLSLNQARADLLFDRGLPVYNATTPNLNIIAGAKRSNSAAGWTGTGDSPSSYTIYGDDFVIGAAGTTYHIDTARVWTVFGHLEETVPPTYPFVSMKLWGAEAGGTPDVVFTSYTATRFYYSGATGNNANFQRGSDGTYFQIWQLDFTINQDVDGGQTYQVFLDGLFKSSYDDKYHSPSLHLSNAALSNTTQAGADNSFLSLAMTWDGSKYVPGMPVQTGLAPDGNIQLYGSAVPLPSTLLLLGSGLLGLAGVGRRFRKR